VKYLFLDESGSHDLTAVDPEYPVFVLGGVVVDGDQSVRAIGEAVAALKAELFGTGDVVLHTADICRNRRGFESLHDPSVRAQVRSRLNALLSDLEYSVIACVVHKRAHLARHGADALDPYVLCLGILVERFCFEIESDRQRGAIVVEQRTPQLDRQVEHAWAYLRAGGTRYVRPSVIAKRIVSFSFASKKQALAGLELADLVVTPIGRAALGRSSFIDFDVVETKLRRDKKGRVEGVGLVVLPKGEGRVPLRSSRPRESV
jgi:hypothetical protein